MLIGRSVPYGDGATWWPLVVMLRSVGGVEAVQGLLETAEDRSEIFDRLRSAVGTGTIEYPNDEIFWAVRRLVETIGQERPLVVCLDDAQWAEPAFHDLLDYLHAFIRDVPVAIIRSGRPELAEVRPGPPGWQLLDLEPLGEDDARALLRELDASDTQRDAIAAVAEGNPLFLEQPGHDGSRASGLGARRSAVDRRRTRRAPRPARPGRATRGRVRVGARQPVRAPIAHHARRAFEPQRGRPDAAPRSFGGGCSGPTASVGTTRTASPTRSCVTPPMHG